MFLESWNLKADGLFRRRAYHSFKKASNLKQVLKGLIKHGIWSYFNQQKEKNTWLWTEKKESVNTMCIE